ncbi:hypothetical protein F4811DRAFT_573204 [Daldinia bambusicola]|nr:hypothetical protein F4811DRAFT_573204 [Daldinia bambusicola]
MASENHTYYGSSCIVCNSSNALFCNRCKSTRYCSKGCQRADWTTHKLLCSAYVNFDVTKRPSKEHFRAISFPIGKEKPELFWIHCPWHGDDDDYDLSYQFPDIDKHGLLGENAYPRDMTIQTNKILGRDIPNTIRLSHRDTFLIDGSLLNKSIATITATKPWRCHNWRGPILAYGTEGLGIDQVACRDLDLNDFRHVADYLVTYNAAPTPIVGKPMNSGGIKGVMINCLGDQKMHNKPQFEAVEVPPSDFIFSEYEHDVSDIAERIELPIFTRTCRPDPIWADDEKNEMFKKESPFQNQAATFLHLSLDPEAKFNQSTGVIGYGYAPMQWQSAVGSTLVVRQDKKPLHPLHVEALCRYCLDLAGPLLAHSLGTYAPEQAMKKEAALSMIFRPTFVISWYSLLEKKREKGEDADAPYPYPDVGI